MKLKRLIAFTVVMAIIMSCFCVVATTVSADATGEELLLYLDGTLYNTTTNADKNRTYIVGEAITYYTKSKVDYTDYAQTTYNGNPVKKQQYIVGHRDWATYNITKGIAQSSNGIVTKEGATTGVVATMESELVKTGKYYDVTFAWLQDNFETTFNQEGFAAGYSVVSQSFDFCIPKGTEGTSREWTYSFKNVAETDGEYAAGTITSSLVFTVLDGNLDLRTTYGRLDRTNLKTVEIKEDVWYNLEVRAKVLDDNRLAMGVYLDNELVIYLLEQDGYTNFSKGIHIDRNTYKCTANMSLTADNHISTYYDEFRKEILADTKAPRLPVSDEIELSAEGTVATATITGYEDITSARLVVALYDGETFAGVLSSDNIVEGTGSRTITCNFPTVDSYTKCRLFLFDNYTSLTPLAPMVEK